ncbi:sugar ABC transporter permease [Paenibacillus rhizovicinus]|uniref:Sugar ABC transporter permease n=1 Tax=Paenibacillus rhizovicinus TaxID=2704463 RepID=A0A6C0NYR4_9BACL|nr:sugar ABC transporter permease [Paenibacillus rhizovicinus]QHW31390.1 sugar ABC transporter permease [Paenibacillus rhizovicinus]
MMMIQKASLRRRKSIFRTSIPYLYVLPSIIVMGCLLAYPMFYNLYVSLHRWQLARPDKPFIGFDNFKAVLTDEIFMKVMTTTVIWTVAGVLLQMLLGLFASLYVDERRRSKGVLRSLLLLPWVLPGVVTALMWSWMLQSDMGILNYILQSLHITDHPISWLGSTTHAMWTLVFVNTWKAFPFWFLMLLAGLQDIPNDQVEAARIDGARWLGIVRYVKIPHLTPIIGATGVITTIWTLNYFDLIWVTTKGGPMDTTSTLPIYTYRLAFEFFDFGKSSAMAIVSLVLIGIICSPYLRAMLKSIKE